MKRTKKDQLCTRRIRVGKKAKRPYNAKPTITYNILGFVHYLDLQQKKLGRTPTVKEMCDDLKVDDNTIRRFFSSALFTGLLEPIPVIYRKARYPKKSEVNLRLTGNSRKTPLFFVGKEVYDKELED